MTFSRSMANAMMKANPPSSERWNGDIASQNSGASSRAPVEFVLIDSLASDGNPNPSGMMPTTRGRVSPSVMRRSMMSGAPPKYLTQV